MNIDQDEFVSAGINFSAQTNSKNLLDLFLDKLFKKKKDLIGPPAGKKMVLFIDDVNMPQPEKYGAQPSIELLRQVIDHGGFYDLKKLHFIHIKDCQFITSCAPPGGGRNKVKIIIFFLYFLIFSYIFLYFLIFSYIFLYFLIFSYIFLYFLIFSYIFLYFLIFS